MQETNLFKRKSRPSLQSSNRLSSSSKPKKESKSQIMLEQPKPQDYYQAIRSQFEKNKHFYSDPEEFEKWQGTINDFFFSFYQDYSQQQIFQKGELKQKCKKIINQYSNQDTDQALLSQLLLADSALYHTPQKHRLRINQLMTIYIYLKFPNSLKILLEILTGEGKTTIISCLAAILYMRGLNVDIITTNSMLVNKDLKQKMMFYELLGIPADNNFPKNPDEKVMINFILQDNAMQIEELFMEHKKVFMWITFMINIIVKELETIDLIM